MVPEGDVDALVEFVKKLTRFRPETSEQLRRHRVEMRPAMVAAARRIIELEPDKTNDAYYSATTILLAAELESLATASEAKRKQYTQDVVTHLGSRKPSGPQIRLIIKIGQRLEAIGDQHLAAHAYQSFARVLGKHDEERLKDVQTLLTGMARRIDLVGKPVKVFGETLNGEKFQWEEYRGKIVLIDFWGSWCGPCLGQMPVLKELYAAYHERGFEVVGVTVDENRGRLELYLEMSPVPWTILHERNRGRTHPVADYYSISQYPTMWLVDRQGKVISLNARGARLRQLLATMLGPPDATRDPAGG